jgi:hypothetical protein
MPIKNPSLGQCDHCCMVDYLAKMFSYNTRTLCSYCYNKVMAFNQSASANAQQVVCNVCGKPSTTGCTCGACILHIKQQAHKQQAQQYYRTYPGARLPIDPWELETPKINNDVVKWKEHFEGIGMPWNFYESLLLAAKSLREGKPQSCAIDKDGWFILKYENQWIKLKISEITVEPPG